MHETHTTENQPVDNTPSAQDSPTQTNEQITASQEHQQDPATQEGEQGSSTETPQTETAKPARSTTPDPLSDMRDAMRQKRSIMAKVLKWQRNGLEIELEGGIIGFMPNEMIDRDPNRNIGNYFGKTLPVKVTSVKPGSHKAPVIVSHRAVLEEELRTQGKELIQSMNVGDILEGKVKSFNNQGVVLDVGTGVEAVIRLQDLSWNHFDHPYEVVKRGESLKAKILQVDKGRRRVALGVRQLTPDPQVEKYGQFKEGQKLTGKVLRINEYGAEVDLGEEMVGFMPISEISWTRINTVRDAVSEGEEIEVQVIRVDPEARKLTVSKKQLIENPMRKAEGMFKPGSDHDGKVKSADRNGITVELADGMEGFVPRRELSHDRVERVEDSFKAGQALSGMRVIEFDRRSGKPTLSLIAAEKDAQRQTMKNYKATSKASSFTLGDLSELKAKLEKIERGGS